MKITKPMLAGKFKNYVTEVNKLPFDKGIYATQKMDGIRALMVEGKLLSRSFIPISNNYIRTLCEKDLPDGLDGELLTKEFYLTAGDVMREAGEPDFRYYVFDYVKDSLFKPYIERVEDLKKLKLPEFCIKVIPIKIDDAEALNKYEEQCIQDGFEGVCIRLGSSIYKEGRGTLNKCDLVKIKRFEDAEAKVIGFNEQLKNTNTAEKDNFGRTKRSSEKDGLIGKNTLGALEVEIINGDFKGVKFSLGTGFNDKNRREIWDNKNKYIGKILTFKYQPIGSLNAPRIPIFKGWRSSQDMS